MLSSYTITRSAFKNYSLRYTFEPSRLKTDPERFVFENMTRLVRLVSNYMDRHGPCKAKVDVRLQMKKLNYETYSWTTAIPTFTSRAKIVVNKDDIRGKVKAACKQALSTLDTWVHEGSGWIVNKCLDLTLNLYRYKTVHGGCGDNQLPVPYNKKRSITHVKNRSDNKCFVYAVLASLYPCKTNKTRAGQYDLTKVDTSMLTYPVPLSLIPKFESANRISINVYTLKKGRGGLTPECIFLSSLGSAGLKHVNLLLYMDHYYCINNMSGFLPSYKRDKAFQCNVCLLTFKKESSLKQHACVDSFVEKMPTLTNNYLYFKRFDKQRQAEFMYYVDIETASMQVKGAGGTEGSKSERTGVHVPIAAGCLRVCRASEFSWKTPMIFHGEDCVRQLLDFLLEDLSDIDDIQKNRKKPLVWRSEEERLGHERATVCYLCKLAFMEDKNADHCHLTGNFLGSACTACNLHHTSMNGPKATVVAHNLTGFDSHFFIRELDTLDPKDIDLIARNSEKLISFKVKGLTFIDSLSFLQSSLSNLVDIYMEKGASLFVNTRNLTKSHEEFMLITRKGVFPYEHITSLDTLLETQLPPQSAFFSSLSNSHISDSDYAHALNVWKVFGCQTLKDYTHLYLKSDIALLADVFEEFRRNIRHYYGLDPAFYYTIPGLTMDAALKMSGAAVELFTDIDMYKFIESGIRGGVCTVSKRFASANNKYLSDYDPRKESSYIMYFDCVNLYGYCMTKPLPYSGFKWLSSDQLSDFSSICPLLPTTGDYGYIVECDLEYPRGVHDDHSDFPCAPERRQVYLEELSELQRGLAQFASQTGVQKLVPNLYDKEKYILDLRNLQFYISHGMKLGHVYRVLTFKQKAWLKEYVEFNTEMRKKCHHKCETDLFKLMNNSLYGKTIENVRNRVHIKLMKGDKRLLKQIAKPTFEGLVQYTPELVGVQQRTKCLKLNKPVSSGFTILDLAKLTMFQFHYDVMRRKYGNRAILLYTDTDSLIYEIKTEDVYRDMQQDLTHFDTSNYPKDHFLYSTRNAKVLGKFKDEVVTPIKEFCGVKSKAYSVKTEDSSKDMVKAKGVHRSALHDLTHEVYLSVLFDQRSINVTSTHLRSVAHRVHTVKIQKTGLTPFDDKRYTEDGVHTLALGHSRIRDGN